MGVMDNKVLIFVNFNFGLCWRGTVHPVVPLPPGYSLFVSHQLINGICNCKYTYNAGVILCINVL